MSTSYERFFQVGEVVGLVLALLSWTDVMRAAKINHAWQEYIQDLVTGSNAQLLQQFLHPDHHAGFWNVLHVTNSAISGEFPLALMFNFPTMPVTNLPMLELITPKHQFSVVSGFFHYLGYQVTRYVPSVLIVRTTHTKQNKIYFAKTVNHRDIWVCVSQSPANDVWPFLFSTRTTSEMNAVTSGTIYSVYPTLTLNRMFLRNKLLRTQRASLKLVKIHREYGFTPAPDAVTFGLPCGPIRDHDWRTTVKMQGIGQFTWNVALRSKLSHTHYKWRLTDICTNPFCSDFQLPSNDISTCVHPIDVVNYIQSSTPLVVKLESLFRQPACSDVFHVAGRRYFNSFMEHLCEYFQLGLSNDFTDIMRHCDVVISGSCALLALRPGTFMPNDIDFYIGAVSDCEPLRHSLALSQYALVLGTNDAYRNRYSSRLIDHVELFHHESEPRSIQIIYTTSRSPLGPIIDFDTTLLMNYITADNIVSLYPGHVLHNMGKRVNVSTRSLELFSKYARRGFRIMAQLLWERDNATYDWKMIPDPSALIIPPNMITSDILSNISWVLPFIPADDTEQHEAGFWCEEIDGFDCLQKLTGHNST